MTEQTPVFIVMAGLPASGKSALTKKIIERGEDWFVFSSDAVIEEIAKERGVTYSEMFALEPKIVKIAENQMMDRLKLAVGARKNIIWDRTCLTTKSRWVARNILPGHSATCVFLLPPTSKEDFAIWYKSLNSREGKVIPPHVLETMQRTMVIPTDNEVFSKVIKIPFGAPFEDYIDEIPY